MKICLVCFDFKESNIRLQPWRYIHEISKRMEERGVNIRIISDGYPNLPQKEDIGGVSVYRLKKLRVFPFAKNKELISLIEKESPDAILWSIGATSFYFFRTLKKIKKPIVGLWMGTTYSLNQIWDLGIGELIRNFQYLGVHIISALIPSFLANSVLKLPTLKRIIVLNKNNKNELLNCGFPPHNIFVIPPGVTESDLELPDIGEVEELRRKIGLEENIFVVLYLGSPLSLRGVDTLIDAVSLIYKKITPLKLIILSRREMGNLIDEEKYIKDLCRNLGIEDRVKIISGFLDGVTVKKFIALSDVVALPFKLIQSDTPISILEVMALGRTVISTKMDGIPELLDEGRGVLINPNNSKDLADAIFTLYSNPQLRTEMGERARKYMLKYPTWDRVTENMLSIINEIADQNSDSNKER